MNEYGSILGAGGAFGSGQDHNKKGNKYYQNHLKALELM